MFRPRHRSLFARITGTLAGMVSPGNDERTLLVALRAQARDMVERGYDYPPILCGKIITFGTVTD
jgi:hypothetical protein